MTTTTLELAYDATMESYGHLTARLMALDAQMDNWFGASLSLLPLLPLTILASGRQADLARPEMIAALVGLGAVLSAYAAARLRGRAHAISPAMLESEWIDLEPDQFRKHMISWRGDHYDEIRRAALRKRKATWIMIAGLGVEAAALGLWAALALA